MSWERQIDNYYQKSGEIKRNDTLVLLDQLPEYLRNELSEKPFAVPLRVVSKAQSGKDASHSVQSTDVRELQSGVKQAIATIVDKKRNTVLFVTNQLADGKPLIVTFATDKVFDNDDVHCATSIHYRQNIGAYLEALQDADIFVNNEKELVSLSGKANILDRLQEKNKLIDANISQTPGFVNTQNEKTAGGGVAGAAGVQVTGIADVGTDGEAARLRQMFLEVLDGMEVAKSGANGQTEIKYSLKDIEKYTEKQYDDRGWVVVHDVLNRAEFGRLMSQFADALKWQYQYPHKGKTYRILVTDNNDHYNKLVCITGTMESPVIKAVYSVENVHEYDRNIVLEELSQNGEEAFEDYNAYCKIEGTGFITRRTANDYPAYSELAGRYDPESKRRSDSYLFNGEKRDSKTEASDAVKYSLQSEALQRKRVEFTSGPNGEVLKNGLVQIARISTFAATNNREIVRRLQAQSDFFKHLTVADALQAFRSAERSGPAAGDL